MADLPVELTAELAAQLTRALDPEGKIPRALDALGPLHGRDVVLIDGGGGIRAQQLVELGARLTAVRSPTDAVSDLDGVAEDEAAEAVLPDVEPPVAVVEGSARHLGLADSSADVIVSCWSSFRGASEGEVAEADRVLRPGGRLLVLHDYGRDDVSALWPGAQADHFAWSRRDGWFLRSGFRIRVIHCWWTFDSMEDAERLLTAIAGERGSALAATMKRRRLSYNVAIYHRTRGDDGSSPRAATAAPSVAG